MYYGVGKEFVVFRSTPFNLLNLIGSVSHRGLKMFKRHRIHCFHWAEISYIKKILFPVAIWTGVQLISNSILSGNRVTHQKGSLHL